MPPGGETFRLSPRFGENVLRHGSHEWLPYSKDEVRLKSSNTNLPGKLSQVNKHIIYCQFKNCRKEDCVCRFGD